MTTIRVDGLQELGKAMKTLTEDVNKRIARAATGAAAQVVRKAAVDNINRSPSVETGNLRRNVIAKRLPPNEAQMTSAHIVTVRKGRVTKKQYAKGLRDAYYARYVEFGTVDMPAEPFLRPALDNNVQKAINAMKDRLRDRFKKAGAL